jgi:hypothetical protein
VRTEDNASAGWNLSELFDKNSACGPQLFHYVAVMNNFLPDVDRSAVKIECDFNNIDSPDYSSAKSAGAQQDYLFSA